MLILVGKKRWKMVCVSLLLVSLVGCTAVSEPQADSPSSPSESLKELDWPDLNYPMNRNQINWKTCASMTELDKETTCIPDKNAKDFIMRAVCYLAADESETETEDIPPAHWSYYQNGQFLGGLGMDCGDDVESGGYITGTVSPDNFDPANGSLTIKVDQLPDGAQFRLVAGTVEHK